MIGKKCPRVAWISISLSALIQDVTYLQSIKKYSAANGCVIYFTKYCIRISLWFEVPWRLTLKTSPVFPTKNSKLQHRLIKKNFRPETDLMK